MLRSSLNHLTYFLLILINACIVIMRKLIIILFFYLCTNKCFCLSYNNCIIILILVSSNESWFLWAKNIFGYLMSISKHPQNLQTNSQYAWNDFIVSHSTITFFLCKRCHTRMCCLMSHVAFCLLLVSIGARLSLRI